MKEFINEIKKKILTKDELILFLEQIDLAYDLISKNLGKSVSEILKNKVNQNLLSVLVKIEKENEEREREQLEKEKAKTLEKEKETKTRLEMLLEKEKELEEKIIKIEGEEIRVKGEEIEKELEKERWKLEEERIRMEREKWELKENLQKFKESLEKTQYLHLKKDPHQILFFLEELRKEIGSLPEINLQIAFDPSEEVIWGISRWFEEKLQRKFILNFEIKPRIIGGAIVEYKGKVLDFSLRKEIKKK